MVSLIFLRRSLDFPILLFSSISLHWSPRKAFLSLLAILWNSTSDAYLSFSPLLFASLLFTAICKASPDSHFAFNRICINDYQSELILPPGGYFAMSGNIFGCPTYAARLLLSSRNQEKHPSMNRTTPYNTGFFFFFLDPKSIALKSRKCGLHWPTKFCEWVTQINIEFCVH